VVVDRDLAGELDDRLAQDGEVVIVAEQVREGMRLT
jgi:hypothetical protein